jgi:hypothetical protein
MKMVKIALAICLGLTIGLSTVHAGPPKKDRICTIGWYKNHGFDTWYGTCVAADGAAFCDALNDEMYTTGAHAGAAKNAAADYIVANYVGFGNETCEEALD